MRDQALGAVFLRQTSMKGVSRVQAGGVRLEVRDSGGGGEPVLLIHGFPDSLELWGAQAGTWLSLLKLQACARAGHTVPEPRALGVQVTCLAGAGYRVVAPSLPGCGGSEQPADVAAYSLPRLLRCMLALLDALGISKVGGRTGGWLLDRWLAPTCCWRADVACGSSSWERSPTLPPGCLLACHTRQAHVVGHDWGASLAWYVAMRAPERVAQLAVLSVGHAGGRAL